MNNNQIKANPNLGGFIGFIPMPLKLKNKPELSVFPFNVLIGRFTIRNNKQVIGTALYEPDLSSFKIDNNKNLVMIYRNRYDSRYILKIYLDKSLKNRNCEKYRGEKLIATANEPIDWKKQNESWTLFFKQVALIGLDDGENCYFNSSNNK
ncbi:hypothetical protein K9M42_02200 [Patescibacteria group bacterium]|nr:hypothetical protein [Patescibacteria group bacterium]